MNSSKKMSMVQNGPTDNKAYSAPIVSKAMKVLKLIVASPKNPGISEIASKLSLAKSTTHGILAAFEESGWVLRDPVTRKYTCGYAVKNLAGLADVRIPLVSKARPYLDKLGRELDENVFLGIRIGAQLLVLDQVESSRDLKIMARPGTRLSVFAGAAGKIFLAYQDRELVEEFVRSQPIPQFTLESITDHGAYMADLDRVRDEGVAMDVGEYIFNVWCVAVPIFYGKKNRKRLVGGFWVVGFNSEEGPQRIQTAMRLARAAGDSISRAISQYNSNQSI